MSMRKPQEELEDNEDSLEKRRGPIPKNLTTTTTTGDVSGQSSLGTAHQTDHDKYEQVGFEIKNSEIKSKSAFEVLKKHFPKPVEQSQKDNFQSMETALQIIKKRCELFQKFADQSTRLQNTTDQNVTSSCEKLSRLLQMYHYGLALLLKERCYFSLMYGEYLQASIYGKQLANLAGSLLDTDLQDEARSILSKKFTEIKDKPNASLLYKKHEDAQRKSEMFLEIVRSGSKNRRNEYAILKMLYGIHVRLFNTQEALDLMSECLKIACELNDEEMIITMISNKAHILQLLGKYQDSYDILSDILALQIDNVIIKCLSLCNFSVVALLLEKKVESLQCAWDSLEIAQTIGQKSWIACCYGNIGLAEESMGEFADAIEHYQKCLDLGIEANDDRVINNGYCNLGRAHEGLEEKEKAKEYYQKAVDTPQPPKAHWCDTEDFRFSGDFLLAKMAIRDRNWPEARSYLQQVLKRCDSLRRGVQDSSLKITFNDTQKKPYQYLQHVLLEEGAKEDALLVAEKGRGRDFYDKVANKGDQGDCLNTPQALLDFAKSQKVAVLFLSTLKVVNTLCGWFISSDGSIETFSAPQTEWENILTELCVTMHQLQGKYKIEFRGIEDKEDEEDATFQQVFELLKKVNAGVNGGLNEEIIDTGKASNFKPTCQPQTCATTNQISTRLGGSYTPDKTKPESTSGLIPGYSISDHNLSPESDVQGIHHHEHSEAEKSLSTLIDKLSDLVVKPIESHLQKLVDESTDTPQLLIIPQGMTFNIPYAALHLNGKPLCSQVTLIEAFSFHSFSHSIQQQEKSKEERAILQDALVVGNPTNDLPGAEAEAIQIANVLGVSPLIGQSATREEVLSHLPHQRIIHFACHGQCDGRSLKMASVGKRSTSGSEEETFLTIEDVEKMKVRADMVVLSACHTARGKISSEGVLGLTRAFLIAGAKSVVTALWAIPDAATKHFMKQFYLNLRDGQPVADALGTTMCQMQEKDAFKNVVHWGSFKALGANQRVL